MKKILSFCLLLISILFAQCSDEQAQIEEELGTSEYTLTITPSTVAAGGDITLTLSGDDIDTMTWITCYSSADGTINSCLMTQFVDGKAVHSTSGMSAGEYTFYSSCGDLKSTSATVTITQ